MGPYVLRFSDFENNLVKIILHSGEKDNLTRFRLITKTRERMGSIPQIVIIQDFQWVTAINEILNWMKSNIEMYMMFEDMKVLENAALKRFGHDKGVF